MTRSRPLPASGWLPPVQDLLWGGRRARRNAWGPVQNCPLWGTIGAPVPGGLVRPVLMSRRCRDRVPDGPAAAWGREGG